jgi:alkylation response protein AidB-like acyl-CoA dehydrogenase
MRLGYTDEDLRFAEEIREFVRAELPEGVRSKSYDHVHLTVDERRGWQRKLAAKGWGCPSWPEEWGGTKWSVFKRYLFEEAMAEEGAPEPVPFGQSMIAPVLFRVGTQAQKEHYLPRILTLDYWFCQGFSEPESGSDLASLKTRAVRDGDHWVINGQKMWTSMAHHANIMFCLVRTDPNAAKRQEGISMLIVPMDTPGLTVRPTITIDGGHSVNEVFFDNVRVSQDALIGEVNKGWTYAKLLLGHERTSIARIGQSKRELKRLKMIASEQQDNGVALLDTPIFRSKVAEVEVELMALELTNLRMMHSATRGGSPGIEANILKIRGSEIQQRLTELMMEAVGPYALPFDERVRDHGLAKDRVGPLYVAGLGPNYLMTRVVTIYGGSNEIQRNIIAKFLGH